MKKLLSIVLVLAMLASMCIYLPMGVTAAEAGTTIYSEDFAEHPDGDMTLADLADLLGWTLIRGDEAATATISGGALTIDATSLEQDVVFQIASDARLKENHTLQYDMTKSFTGGNLCFAGMYTGTDNGETVKAIVNKTTYENYNHMALVDGVINETNQRAAGYKIDGGDHDQCRPENIPGGGNTNTWKVVYDVTNNQVDGYASGARINSTVGSRGTASKWAPVNVADYVGTGAYIRVQKSGSATFDNISIVTGGTAVSYGDYAYYQDFSNIPDGTYTGAELAALTGFQTFADTTSVATMVYKIANGRLEIVANGDCTNSYTFKNNPIFATLFVPEMEAAQDTVVIEYDMTYLYDANVEGSANSGDAPVGIEIYGRRSDFHAFWQFSQKGFPQWGFYKGTHTVDSTNYAVTQNGTQTTNGYYPQTQARYEHTNWNAAASNYVFSNGSYGHSLVGSTESIKIVLDMTDGMFLYVNGVLAVQLSQTALEAWNSTLGGGTAKDIIGNLLKFRMPAGCHVALDNIKISADPEEIAGPALWLTEASCGTTGTGWCTSAAMEYVEVYNASTEAINIYDYVLTQRAYSNSLDNVGTAIGLNNVHLAYPGTHTYTSANGTVDENGALLTLTVENPAYADGWLQPGEVAMLWNKTDSMEKSGAKGPYYSLTEADFRAALPSLPETTKVFSIYNDYNRAFNNSGSHFVALVDRDLVQAGYNPATGTGDETLTDALIGFTDYKSTILDVTAYKDSGGNYCNGRVGRTVTHASYDVTEAIGHSAVVFSRPDAALTAASMTPGYVTDTQARKVTITQDEKTVEVNLGKYNYERNDGYYKMLFAIVNGEVVTENFTTTVLGGEVIDRLYVAMDTAPGVGVRIGGDYAGLRWTTAIKDYHLDELNENALVANVKIGTLVAKASDNVELTLANVTTNNSVDGKKVRNVLAYDDVWYTDGTADYNGYKIFAGGVGNMFIGNYSTDYTGVGYVSVTLTTGETITVYGGDAATNNVMGIIDAVYADLENSELTEEELAMLDIYYEQPSEAQ